MRWRSVPAPHFVDGFKFEGIRFMKDASPAELSSSTGLARLTSGGDEGIRTLGPHVANVMLSQLSYIPTKYGAQ